MTQPYWIKLYIEILNDPKMSRLSDRLFRRTIELFLIAGSTNRSGFLPSVEDCAWQLRLSPTKLASDFQALADVGILSCKEDMWNVTNFEIRQSPTDGKERTRRFRDARKQEQYQPPSLKDNSQDVTFRYNPVTPTLPTSETNRYIDTDTELDQETELDPEVETEAEENRPPSPAPSELFTLYQSEIGDLTSYIATSIQKALSLYPHDWIKSAIQESSRHNKRSWSYVETILKRWKSEGFKTDTRPKPRRSKASAQPDKSANLEKFREIYEKQHANYQTE